MVSQTLFHDINLPIVAVYHMGNSDILFINIYCMGMPINFFHLLQNQKWHYGKKHHFVLALFRFIERPIAIFLSLFWFIEGDGSLVIF